jgi:hypothetical protein
MTPKVTMYDSLAMVISGFLILLLLASVLGWLPLNSGVANENSWLSITVISLLSYLIGLMWHKFCDLLFRKFRNCEYSIKHEYRRFVADYQHNSKQQLAEKISENFKHEYYQAYYSLMAKNCLCNIPVLEAQVAFVRNLIPINIIYIIVFLHCDNALSDFVKSQLDTTFAFVIMLLFLFVGLIYLLLKLQSKIYYLVWEGNEYLRKQ